MKTNMQRNLMCAFTGILSLAVVGTLTTPANAQAKMKKQKSAPMKKDSMMKSDNMQGNMMDKNTSAEERRMQTLGEKFGDYKFVDPAPLNYPMAAPATLDVYHFETYRGDHIMPGSAHDARMDKMMMTDKNMMKGDKMMGHGMTRQAYRDDPFTADPAPVNYPLAAPATLDVYTFTDYSMNKITPANTLDTRMDKQMMKDTMVPTSRVFNRQSYYDDPFTADPAPVNYPLAAPASLDLYHFRTYQMNELRSGSVTDTRMDKQMMRDNMTPGSGKMDSTMKSGGTTKKAGKTKK